LRIAEGIYVTGPGAGTRAYGNFFIAGFVARARENHFSPRMMTVRWFDLGDIAKSPTASVVGGAGLEPPFGRQVRSLRKRFICSIRRRVTS
jgi:hypothetical protein